MSIKNKVLLVLASLLLMIVGCSNNNSHDTKIIDHKKMVSSEQIKEPSVEGNVTELISDRVFLLEVTNGAEIFQKGKLVQIGVDDETMLDNIEVGQNVTVWYGSPIYESSPPKTKGVKIEINSD